MENLKDIAFAAEVAESAKENFVTVDKLIDELKGSLLESVKFDEETKDFSLTQVLNRMAINIAAMDARIIKLEENQRKIKC